MDEKENKIKREDGFYWVKSEGKWIVAECESIGVSEGWYICGIGCVFEDSDFERIGEQIKKPED